jgi:hypothetical protein
MPPEIKLGPQVAIRQPCKDPSVVLSRSIKTDDHWPTAGDRKAVTPSGLFQLLKFALLSDYQT